MIRANWSKISEWPQRLAHKIESLNPRLAKSVLNYASQVVQPQLMVSQFLLEEWGDSRVGVTLSARGSGLANILAAAEFMVQTLLRRHIQLPSENVMVSSARVDLPFGSDQSLKLRFELTPHDRENWLGELLSSGQAERTLGIDILDVGELRRGRVELTLNLRHIAALPPPVTQS